MEKIEVTRHGRKFTFDAGTDQKVIDRRIESWMKQNEPDAPRDTTPAPAEPDKSEPSSRLATIAKGALAATPLGLAAAPAMILPGVRKAVDDRLGDVNFYRTLGQGVIPLADEGVAKIRSLIPQSWGGTDYDTALAAERKGVQDYADKHGAVESMALQGAGALATVPLTMGAGAALQGTRAGLMAGQLASKAPGAAKVAAWAANNPRWAQLAGNLGIGATAGGASGFAAGEGGLENRLENAGYGTAFGLGAAGGVHGLGKLGQHIKGAFAGDNAVANYLRKVLPTDRGDAYSSAATARMRTPNGELNTLHPEFADFAADDLKYALAKQRINSTRGSSATGWGSDVMPADVLPRTTEGVLLKGGEDTANLGRDIVKRQYNRDLPEDIARAQSQHGQVSNWLERLYGPNVFRQTEDQLLETLRNNASTAYRAADPKNIMSLELDDVMERIKKLSPEVYKKAMLWAETASGGPRATGLINRHGEHLNYNTAFLNDIKRSLNEAMGEGAKNPKFYDKPYKDAVTDLNEQMKLLNPEYRAAAKQFGEDAQLVEALRKGREDVFSGKGVNELDTGIGKQDIEAFLNDPNIPDAAKDLFRTGGAQALRQKLLGSDAKTFTSDWANIMNKPNLAEKYKALVPSDRLHDWDQMREEMMQLGERHQNMAKALGNSATAKRGEMVKELEQPNMLSDILATIINPSAPSGYRHWMHRITNPGERAGRTANSVANLLAKKGETGNQEAVERIRSILKANQTGRERWNRNIDRTAASAAYSGFPSLFRHHRPQESDERK